MSLLDRHAAFPHDAAVTAACCDASSGARVTADAEGVVAIVRPGDPHASVVFGMAAAVRAVAVCAGGTLVAVGDDQGTIAVHRTLDGECVFEDTKEGDAGRSRAVRALAFEPRGRAIAALCLDGLRVWDLATWNRIAAFPGFAGRTLAWSPKANRLVCCDARGQPRLVDIDQRVAIDVDLVPGGVVAATFTDDGAVVVALGPTGVVRLSADDGRLLKAQGAKGSSGLHGLLVSPDGSRVAAISGRSVHQFRMTDLSPVDSARHGAEDATGVGYWDAAGIVAFDEHGLPCAPGRQRTLAPARAVAGSGTWRAVAHGSTVALWHDDRQRLPFDLPGAPDRIAVDREGRLLVGISASFPAWVADARAGRLLFTGPADTTDAVDAFVAGGFAMVRRASGGIRWWDLTRNQELALTWPGPAALSGSGTWLAVVTPRGALRVLDPRTGEAALPSPASPRPAPLLAVGFAARRPELYAVDADGWLVRWDLAEAARHASVAVGTDVLPVDRPPLRIHANPQGDTVLLEYDDDVVKVHGGKATSLGCAPGRAGGVDPESCHVLTPARGAALLEYDAAGREHAVLRSLPFGGFVAFDARGVRQRG